MKAVLFIALGAALSVAGAAQAGERGHAHRNAAAGYARQLPPQAHVTARSYYSDTGWQGGYGPVQSYGYGYGYGGAGYGAPVVIAPQHEPIRSGWSEPAQRSTPFGYPVQGFGRDYFRSPYAPWAPYGQGRSYGYDQGYAGQGYYGQGGGYSYESRTYVQDGGSRYGWSGGHGCGRCDPRPPVYQHVPAPIHVQAPPVRVQAPPVYVQAPPVYVHPSPVYVEPSVVNVQAPPVHVAAADVRVAPPQVNVAPSQVYVSPPNVDVAPPDVRFDPPPPGYGGYYAMPDERIPPPPPPSPTERPYHGYAQEPGERG